MAATLAFACGEKKESKQQPPAPEPPTDKLEDRLSEKLTAIVATCASAAGQVEVRRAGQTEWEPVATGAAFRQGDRIRTGPRSVARIQFQVGGALTLDENTAVTVDATVMDDSDEEKGASSATVAVEAGTVHGVLGKKDGEAPEDSTVPSGRLYVRTADGQSAALVAGEDESVEFRLTHRDEGTEVAVHKGALKVVPEKGDAGELASGQAADLKKSGLGKVASLLGFPASVSPGIDARFHFKEGLGIDLSWRAVKGAKDYRVQVARDTSFQSIVASEETAKRSFAFSPEAEGMYAWRVAARDAEGRMGEAGFVRRIYCEAEEPSDLLVAPNDGAKFAFAAKERPSIVFSWQSAGAARSYRLLIWRGESPTGKPAVSQVTSSQSHTVKSLSEGRYTWGVYVRGKDDRPLFVSPRSFTIKKSKPPKADTEGLWD